MLRALLLALLRPFARAYLRLSEGSVPDQGPYRTNLAALMPYERPRHRARPQVTLLRPFVPHCSAFCPACKDGLIDRPQFREATDDVPAHLFWRCLANGVGCGATWVTPLASKP
jgi:hypothetical protein